MKPNEPMISMETIQDYKPIFCEAQLENDKKIMLCLDVGL